MSAFDGGDRFASNGEEQADRRDATADERDAAADERERLADLRDVVADRRDARADQRDRELDLRESALDARDAAADRRDVEQDTRQEQQDARDTRMEPVGELPGHLVLLSRREREVLELIAEGLSNREIASRLCVSANTLKSYIRSAYRKAGAESRTQAILWFMHGDHARETD